MWISKREHKRILENAQRLNVEAWGEVIKRIKEIWAAQKGLKRLQRRIKKPIDMLLFCPRCDEQHIDKTDVEKNWTNPPHRSHKCFYCGHIWRPADIATNGVENIKTHGKLDGQPAPKAFKFRKANYSSISAKEVSGP